MKSDEWDARGWKKHTNPSGEVIRTKAYQRTLIAWDNCSPRKLLSERQKLAEILGIYDIDLLCDLDITITCNRFRKHQWLYRYTNKHLKQLHRNHL